MTDRGTVTVGDGSDQKGGKMGAGYVNLRRKWKRQQRKVGREEEGPSSNRLLLFFFRALRFLPVKCLRLALLLTSLFRPHLPIFYSFQQRLVVAQIQHGVCHRGAA